ncbi:MAG: sel1 repeat family protein [Clostridia bacterium]|nr:sel1 repeat family protein [Clostridia bacterium]
MRLAEEGDPDAQCFVGNLYFTGVFDEYVEEDRDEAFRWYGKALEQGSSQAQFFFGSVYFLGQGVTLDYDKAYRYLSMAAEQGHPGRISVSRTATETASARKKTSTGR